SSDVCSSDLIYAVCLRGDSTGHSLSAELASGGDDAQAGAGSVGRDSASDHQRPAPKPQIAVRLGGLAGLVLGKEPVRAGDRGLIFGSSVAALSETETGDYSACVVLLRRKEVFYVLEVVRGRFPFGTLKRKVME